MTPHPSCDIFCRVVDNFGDIGVTWRLARQLAAEHHLAVRLIVDDLASFQKIAPEIIIDKPLQRCGDTAIIHWNAAPVLDVANIVIEAFQCDIPAPYLEKMAAHAAKPVWLNLEYLSAEAWVADHHLLPSPHPRLPLSKTFFFPGFVPGTGGLIRERRVTAATKGVVAESCRVFVFGYDSPPRALALMSAIAAAESVVGITIAEGALADVARQHALPKCEVMPFVPQPEFDSVLAAHDILWVRGEDSLVRALYAARPLVWQIYPQHDGAHLRKLDAFLAVYCAGLNADAERIMRSLSLSANDGDGQRLALAWQNFLRYRQQLQHHAVNVQRQLLTQPDLATNLMTFCEKFLKI